MVYRLWQIEVIMFILLIIILTVVIIATGVDPDKLKDFINNHQDSEF